nr:hypothetical protein [Tanacetum cinerariifolium]
MLKELAASLKKRGVRKADLSRMLSAEHYTLPKSAFRALQDDVVHGDPISSEEGILNIGDNEFDSPTATLSGNVFTPDTTEVISSTNVSSRMSNAFVAAPNMITNKGPNVTVLKEAVCVDDTPIIQSAFINTKSVSYARAAGTLSSEPLKGNVIFRHLESDNVCDGVDLSIPGKVVQAVSSRFENTLYGYFIGKRIAFPVVEYYVRNNWAKYGLTRFMMNSKGYFFFKFVSNKGLENVLENEPWKNRNIFSEDGISLIATQIGKPIMLDSFTSSMCIDSWGWSRFDRCLIEVKAYELLKDSITVGISLPDGLGFTKETVRVEYEWKSPRCEQCKIFGHAYDQCPKSATAIPTVDMTNDGFQTVRFEPKAHGNSPKNENVSTSAKDDPTSSKEEPAKAVDIPSSSYTSATAKKGGLKAPTISSNIPTSNPYDLLSQEFDHENYMRSGGDPNSVYEE